MKDFFKKNWLTVLSLFIGITGILLAVYFNQQTQTHREPIFISGPERSVFLEKNKIEKSSVIVTRKDGKAIKQDLILVKFYFWNNGNLSIRNNEILNDIKISLSDKEAEILDYKILKTSREVVKPSLYEINESKNEIGVNFKILEPNDGFSGQLLIDGDQDLKVDITGIIEGVNEILRYQDLRSKKLSSSWIINIFIIIVSILTVKGFAKILPFVLSKIFSKKILENPILEKIQLFIAILFIIFLLVFIPYDMAKEDLDRVIYNIIPSEINLVVESN